MTWGLPTSVEVQGKEYPIYTDFRRILDIMVNIADPEIDNEDRAFAVLIGLYPDFDDMPPEHWDDAIREGLRFINHEEDDAEAPQKSPKLVDWEKDYSLMIAPINRVMGHDIRGDEYVHWWTFLSAYNEIGECTFAQVVRVRNKLARGISLDKSEREWYRKNRKMVDIERKYTTSEEDVVKAWGGN